MNNSRNQLQDDYLAAQKAYLNWLSESTMMASSSYHKFAQDAWDYWIDSGQRWVLFIDTLRHRGNNMLEHYQAGMPPLLDYDFEVILDARKFERPANYLLIHILSPEGKEPAPGRRPLVIIDPRAGHGPGIGGFKKDSEVGMGLREGHPVYFVAFTEKPCKGQTLEDVELAQIRFLEEVRKRHPKLDLPIVYGNCQAGWAIAMLGADRPDVTGPIVINGAPLSYWAGSYGVNPMRLLGGLTGGAWVTRFLCDLGCGQFDGSHLVANFEKLDPANTLWKKEYNLYNNIDTEVERYLEFERWWTGFFLLNEEEILWIVNNLFIGDKLQKGLLKLGEAHSIDMRNLDDPLVIFASSGDNITPPHQALHWISELYKTTDDLKKAGQRIIYLINPHIGHLGIFVSAKIARYEHRAIIEHIEQIRVLKPGLYQMVIEKETGEKDPLKDQFVVRFDEKEIADVCFPVNQRAFQKTVEVSRMNEELYLKFMRPFIQSVITFPWQAELIRWTSPARFKRYIYSDKICPPMLLFHTLAELARRHRHKVDDVNIFRYSENRMSDHIVSVLNAFRDQRDNWAELVFELAFSD